MKLRLFALSLFILVATLTFVFLVPKHGASVGQTDPQEKESAPAETLAKTTFSAPIKKRPLALTENDGPIFTNGRTEREFVLALDEAVERLPNGSDQTIRLDPPATAETLARRLAEIDSSNLVLPVCYEKGEERTLYGRHLITRDLTIELSNSKELPGLPAGVVLKERPAYAPNHAIVSAEDPFAALEALKELVVTPGVKEAEVQLAVQRSKKALPNDTLIDQMWHIEASGLAVAGSDVNVEEVWAYGETGGVRGNGVRIGIVDDGLQTAHPDLAANVDTENDRDWNGGDFDPNPFSFDAHGTACAGNAGAVGNNNRGVVGTAPESILVGMRLTAAANTDAQEAAAMFYLPNLIEIKSNSWGPPDTGRIAVPGTLMRAAFANAAAQGRDGKGSILLWAGGNGLAENDNSNYDGWANDIHTISIGASTSRGGQAVYSESGANLVVVAPSGGIDIPSTGLGITTTDLIGRPGYSNQDYTNDFNGTSSSTPTVAGIVALMLEKNPNLGWRDVQEILIASASKIDSFDPDWITNAAGFEFNHKYGGGQVDAAAAVALADGWTNLEEALSSSTTDSNINLLIPDDNAEGISHPLTLDGTNIRCEHVTLTVTASHTFRGDLDITLTSPSGTVSQMAETRSNDSGNYSNFTFMTVRNWGEESNGTWTVRIADRALQDRGTLESLTLTAHGAQVAPTNPGPEVAITSPANDTALSPGATLSITATANDFTIDGSPGQVASVEFFNNGLSLGVDTTAPYNYTFSPPNGIYNLTVVATDTEGETTTTPVTTVIVADQAPVVSTASLLPTSQAFSDDVLTVTGVTGSDSEGSPITFKYAWENSSDGLNWQSTSITGDTLPASEQNAGLLWRVQVRSNDGVSDSLPFTTNATNVLTRAPAFAMVGEEINYSPGLVLRSSGSVLTKDVIVNEFSQGSTISKQWIELLVIRDVSLRNWRLSDTNFNSPLWFRDSPVWDDIEAGTLITIYKAFDKDAILPDDDTDPSDYNLVLSSNNSAYFTGGWPGFSTLGDTVLLRDPAGVTAFRFNYGNRNSSNVPNFGSAGVGESLHYMGASEDDAFSPAFWETTNSTVARSQRTPKVATSLPLSFGGSWDNLPNGFTSSGTGVYNTSLGSDTTPGSARFDTSGSTITVEFDAPAAVVSYHLLGNSGGQPNTVGEFLVEESADGINYNSMRSITNKDNTDEAFEDTPSASTRFIRFHYLNKVSGNIQLDKVGITASAIGGNLEMGITIAPNRIFENAGADAAVGTVFIDEPLADDVEVSLFSSAPASLVVPQTVILPAGELTATFPLETIDNSVFAGNTTLVVGTSAPGFTSSSFKVVILDDEEDLEGVTPGKGNNIANSGFIEGLRLEAFNGPALFRLASGTSLPTGLSLDPNSGIISGTIDAEAPLTSYPITIERYNDFPEIVSYSFELTVIEESNFATWISSQGVAETEPTDDPDGDGLVNILEYYLAGDAALSSQEIAPVFSVEGGENTLGFWHLKTANDVTGIVEWSDTLEENSWSTEGVTSQVTIDEATREYIEATVPSGADKRFVRLRVESN